MCKRLTTLDQLSLFRLSFTSEPIAEALVRAHGRGVEVQAILDKSQRTQKYTAAELLIQDGIPVLIDASHSIAHNKVMIIDNETVIARSFNFTKAVEERNSEDLSMFSSRELSTRSADNWRTHQSHSNLFAGGSSSKNEPDPFPDRVFNLPSTI